MGEGRRERVYRVGKVGAPYGESGERAGEVVDSLKEELAQGEAEKGSRKFIHRLVEEVSYGKVEEG